MTATDAEQLTLWPDHALPGQLALFNRRAAVGVYSEEASRSCECSEAVVVRLFWGICTCPAKRPAAFLPNRKTRPMRDSPAAEPISKRDDWFGNRPHTVLNRAASTSLS